MYVPALAQDPNFEQRLDVIAPIPDAPLAQPTETVETVYVSKPVLRVELSPDAAAQQNTLSLDTGARRSMIDTLKNIADRNDVEFVYRSNQLEVQNFEGGTSGLPTIAIESVSRAKLLSAAADIKSEFPELAKSISPIRDTGKTQKVPEQQKTTKPPQITTTLTGDTSYAWDSNAYTRKLNVVEDSFFTTLTQVSVAVPLRKTTQLLLLASTTYARYNEETTLESDVALGSVSLAETLSTTKPNPKSSTERLEVLTLKATARLSYEPGFEGPGSRVYTPFLEWKTTGIPLGSRLCATTTKKVMQNCFVGTLLAGVGQTWSGSNGAGKNAAFNVGAGVGWNFYPGWSFDVSAGVKDRYYEDYDGGRNDVAFSGSAGFTWTPTKEITVTAGVSYNDQDSSVNALDYDQTVASPSVRGRLKF
jgi:hypothetical protein